MAPILCAPISALYRARNGNASSREPAVATERRVAAGPEFGYAVRPQNNKDKNEKTHPDRRGRGAACHRLHSAADVRDAGDAPRLDRAAQPGRGDPAVG